ncbi:MAG: hypothetical protein F6K40_06165 [Okeania sp. SIO3I5]|uniref:hypothetical protein n=1 Tax=Okeania sp. SIO3I5 TaxID=2607805 RepID=UPI0013BD6A5E|nr:hypothetical protein [Okeania sp. SIO3I5]NEQ35893.1 hypothetical protein [Okeania sp. SIO3I5]
MMGMDVPYYFRFENDWYIYDQATLNRVKKILGVEVKLIEITQHQYFKSFSDYDFSQKLYFFKVEGIKKSSDYFDSWIVMQNYIEGVIDGLIGTLF